jgi:hypothetical protein
MPNAVVLVALNRVDSRPSDGDLLVLGSRRPSRGHLRIAVSSPVTGVIKKPSANRAEAVGLRSRLVDRRPSWLTPRADTTS